MGRFISLNELTPFLVSRGIKLAGKEEIQNEREWYDQKTIIFKLNNGYYPSPEDVCNELIPAFPNGGKYGTLPIEEAANFVYNLYSEIMIGKQFDKAEIWITRIFDGLDDRCIKRMMDLNIFKIIENFEEPAKKPRGQKFPACPAGVKPKNQLLKIGFKYY